MLYIDVSYNIKEVVKIENVHMKNMIYFSYFCTKHRLWLHVVNGYPQFMCCNKNEKKVYPCIPQFCYIKVGYRGYTLNGHVFAMIVTNQQRFCTLQVNRILIILLS